MAKNKGFNAPPANTPEATAQDNDVLKGVDDDVFEEPVVGELVERPSYPSYVLGGEVAELKTKLPHAAFKAAAAKYYPEQCVIIAYKVTDTGTIVVLDAGLQGRRKETIGA